MPVPAVYAVVMLAVWLNMFRSQKAESLVGLGFMVVGGGLYWAFLRRPV